MDGVVWYAEKEVEEEKVERTLVPDALLLRRSE
jgi:hypothetical protein